jgi:hypothetical protein
LTQTGIVSFYNGPNLVNSTPVANGLAVYNYRLTVAGTEALSAKYSGDANFVASTSGKSGLTVIARTASATTLAVSSASVTKGTIVTLTSTVIDAGKPVTQGMVTFCNAARKFCEDGAVLGTAHLTSTGTAAIKLALPVGTNSIKAVFNGTAQVVTSQSGTQSVTVTGPLPSAISVVASGTPGNYTLTTSVTGSWPPPRGQFSIVDASNNNLLLAAGSVDPNPAFTQSSATAVSAPNSIAVGDFNGDGKQDMAVASISGNSVSILLGNGNGTFTVNPAAMPTTPSLTRPDWVVTGDFNGDGNLDLAVGSYNSAGISIFLGNGNATFRFSSTAPSGDKALAIALGDFNGDGKLDLAATNYTSDYLSILLGNGDGTFSPELEAAFAGSSAHGILAADFDGDGKLDLAVVDENAYSVSILLGNGDGTFALQPVGLSTGGNLSFPIFLTAGDFNGDGRPDLAVGNTGTNTVAIFLNTGAGAFTNGPTLQTGRDPLTLAAGDFNGDGNIDLIVANIAGSSLTLFSGSGTGTFTAQTIPLASGVDPFGIVVADFNDDGGPDLAFINSNAVPVLLTSAVATRAISGIMPPGGGTHSIDAVYAPGSTVYAGSTSTPVSLPATPIPTSVSVVSSPASPVSAGTTSLFRPHPRSTSPSAARFRFLTGQRSWERRLFQTARLRSAPR